MATAPETQREPLMLEDTFSIKGKKYTATLTPATLKWCTARDKSKDEVVVPVEEILSVTVSTEKMKKPDMSLLKLVYMNRKKNQNLRRVAADLVGNSDTCTKWTHNVQECINAVPSRPKSALVLVNSISGGRKGPKQYKDIVAPVFKEAAIKTEVIVTESPAHVTEIIQSYDLASIDSLVIVGGDGTYHLVVDAYLQRLMKEAGLDVNDPENDVPEVKLPIGLIPCGTGNGIAAVCYACYDVETAALAVVRGGKQNLNVHGIWSGGEFQMFSILLQGLGTWADLIYDTEARRSMGVWRYPVVIGSYLFKSSCRMLDVTIETKAPAKQQEPEDPENDNLIKCAGDIANPSQSWKTWQGRCSDVSAFLADTLGYKESRNPAHLKHSRCFWMHRWSRASFSKFFYYLIKFNPAMLHWDKVDHEPFIEYKVTLNNPDEQGSHANLINIDGEAFYLKHPNYHVKINSHWDKVDHEQFIECKVTLNNSDEQGSHVNLINGEEFYLKHPNYHVKVFPGKMSLFASVAEDYLLTLY